MRGLIGDSSVSWNYGAGQINRRYLFITCGEQGVWSDNETTIDYLNFGVVADACAKLLQQARGVPISVGISGGWGAGKSSLVRMIEGWLKQAETPGQEVSGILCAEVGLESLSAGHS